jgi:hypothetical protein
LYGAGRPQELDRIPPAERIAEILDLSGVEERENTDRAGDVERVLGVEDECLVPAGDEARRRIARRDRPQVEAADVVFAAQGRCRPWS